MFFSIFSLFAHREVFAGGDAPFLFPYLFVRSGIRAGEGILHIAAQLKEDLIKRIGSAGLQLSGDGLVGLRAQGGTAGRVGLLGLFFIVGVQQSACGGEDAFLVALDMEDGLAVSGIGHAAIIRLTQ